MVAAARKYPMMQCYAAAREPASAATLNLEAGGARSQQIVTQPQR